MREIITLECTACKSRNYSSAKNKSLHSERVEYVKFCKKCNKRVSHKETR
ncbi:MAG: 50S ribosomal protein L33 [Elusimicrobia bacterium RIFOXYB2_FULL_49_7]|nr:MAG: 50S ribosomal protein L33 [Elusimicrobia bacterium RIFOXYB2_FULL_49_7]